MPDSVTRLNAALEGRYRIERELGEGGMATVYLADDLRHERKVALKVLKPELAAVVGAERFLAEIKTTANLQHPHILPLHDSGEADGFLFYVMPYVEGESLRERLDREHQLSVDEAVGIATKVAGALEAAHERGVIHRDVKPANILLSKGEPLVSDFGISLAVGAAGGGRLTETGLSLGTPHYMSPEQATGDLGVGTASDVYALGCVLYEMLVGDPPYVGSTAQAILGKIVTGDADPVTKHRKTVPLHVDAAVRKALEKVPADRFASALDFARALADVGFRHGELIAGIGGRAARTGPWNRLTVGFAASAAVMTLAFGWSALRPGAGPAPVSRQVISVPPAAPVALSATLPDVAISQDGRAIVYQSVAEAGAGELVVRMLDQLESVTLRGPEVAFGPFFSPDGAWIGYLAGSGGALQRVSVQGGPPLTIAALPGDLRGGSWGPDGTIFFGVNLPGGIRQVPAAGGDPAFSTEMQVVGNQSWPDALPNGRGVLFTESTDPGTVADNRIAVLDLRSGEYRTIIDEGTFPRYAASGHVVYALGSTLMAIAFDAERLEVLGDPVPMVEGVSVKPDGAASFDVSDTGALVYVTGSAGSVSPLAVVWVDRDGTEEPLPLPPRAYQDPRLSPDGRRLAVGVADGANVALWVYDVVSAAGLRLTQQGTVNTPVWIADGRVAFATFGSGAVGARIHTVMADGSGEPEALFSVEDVLGDYPTALTPDGRTLVFSRILTAGDREIFHVSLEGDRTPEPLLQGEFNRGNAEVSPDGRWLVYRSDQSGQMEVYVQPYPGPGPTVPISIGGGTSVTWSPDGAELIYRLDDRMMAVPFDVDVEGQPRIGRPVELFRGDYVAPALGGARQYHVSPDGRFLMLKAVGVGASGDELPPQVVLVQNWFEELRERVPN